MTTPTQDNIKDAINQGVGSVFYMKSVTDYEWDRLFVFEPYTLRATIHETVGTNFLKANEISSTIDEAYCLLVFMNNGDVVEYFTYHRRKGDFDRLANKTDGYSPDDAVFKVVVDPGKWVRIVEAKK